jgi:hypothetical protein
MIKIIQRISIQHILCFHLHTFTLQFKNISLALSTSFTIGPTGGQFVIGEYSNNTGIFSNFETFTSHNDLNFFIKNDVGQLGYENGIYNNLGK